MSDDDLTCEKHGIELRRCGCSWPSAPTPLQSRKREPDPEVIDMLERLLQRAKDGEVVSLAIAAELTARETLRWMFVPERGDIACLLLSIERLKIRLCSIGCDLTGA